MTKYQGMAVVGCARFPLRTDDTLSRASRMAAPATPEDQPKALHKASKVSGKTASQLRSISFQNSPTQEKMRVKTLIRTNPVTPNARAARMAPPQAGFP